MLRWSAVVVVVVGLLVGCSSEPGAQGPEGPAGAAGPRGEPGPAGPPGPQGAVLLVDGGVLMGPPGAGVVVAPVSAGSPVCPTGGVRVTQLSDGGVTYVCSGAVGAQGPAGPAGPAGPQGPPGEVLFVDGGSPDAVPYVGLVGFTTAVYDGNLGGNTGANQKCNAQFPGSYFCTAQDYYVGEPRQLSSLGAWVDADRDGSGERTTTLCNGSSGRWTGNQTSASGWYITSGGRVMKNTDAVPGLCNVQRPLACCTNPGRMRYRGATTALVKPSALGGFPVANQHCNGQYPGSFFCTRGDFALSEPLAVPSATIFDDNRAPWRAFAVCAQTSATNAAVSYTGTVSNPWLPSPQGNFSASGNCNTDYHLACCSR